MVLGSSRATTSPKPRVSVTGAGSCDPAQVRDCPLPASRRCPPASPWALACPGEAGRVSHTLPSPQPCTAALPRPVPSSPLTPSWLLSRRFLQSLPQPTLSPRPGCHLPLCPSKPDLRTQCSVHSRRRRLGSAVDTGQLAPPLPSAWPQQCGCQGSHAVRDVTAPHQRVSLLYFAALGAGPRVLHLPGELSTAEPLSSLTGFSLRRSVRRMKRIHMCRLVNEPVYANECVNACVCTSPCVRSAQSAPGV